MIGWSGHFLDINFFCIGYVCLINQFVRKILLKKFSKLVQRFLRKLKFSFQGLLFFSDFLYTGSNRKYCFSHGTAFHCFLLFHDTLSVIFQLLYKLEPQFFCGWKENGHTKIYKTSFAYMQIRYLCMSIYFLLDILMMH